jgi:hypothetical protein
MFNHRDRFFIFDVCIFDVIRYPVNITSSTIPSLYDIVRRGNALVADVLTGNPINIEFRRTLSANKWKASLAAFTKPSHLRESDRDS